MAAFLVTLKESNAPVLPCELVGIRTKSLACVLTAVTLCCGTVACSSDSGDAPQAAEVTVPGVSVSLEQVGQAPREPLVWFSDESEQQVLFSATQGLEQETKGEGAERQAESLPYDEVTMELPLVAQASTDGEERTSTVTVGKPSGTNAERNEDIASAEGFTMTTTQSNDGRAKSRTFQAPEAATDSARASVETALTQMNDFPLVFPTEPIGPGAQWTVANRVEEGVSMLQEVTYTLMERQGQAVSLKVEVQRKPAVTSLSDTDLEVMDISSTSSGQLHLDLNLAVPVRGNIDVTTTVTYGKEDSPVRVLQTSTSKSTWAPRG